MFAFGYVLQISDPTPDPIQCIKLGIDDSASARGQTLRRVCFQGKSSRKRAREATRVSRFSPIDLRDLDSIKRNSPHHRRRQWLQSPLSRSTSWCSWAISRWGRRASSPDSCTTSSTTPIRLSPAMKTEPYFLNLFELCLVFIGSSRLGFDPNRLM